MARTAVTNRRVVANMPYSLHFDGTQRAALTTMGNLGSSFLNALSFGCWLKTTSVLTTSQYLFGCSQSTGGNYAFAGMTRTSGASQKGKPFFLLRDASGRTLAVEALNTPINKGEWVHVVFIKDATNTPGGMKIYINGVAQTLTTVSNAGYADPIDFNRAMAIGSSLGSGAVASAWVGSISQPFFFKRELTQQEINDWIYKKTIPSTEFAGYLNNEGAGTAVADTQATHNGTLTAAGQWSSADVPYKTRPVRLL